MDTSTLPPARPLSESGDVADTAIKPGQASLTQPGSRIDWIDAAKGAGILLVVTGHVLTTGTWYAMIYTFHMPMFFILAGIVYRWEPMAEQFSKRLLSLMLPYACFLLIVILMRNVLEYRYGASIGQIIHDDGYRLLAGLKGGTALSGDFGTFWFVSCLFLSMIAYNGLRTRLPEPTGGAMIAVMITLLVIAYSISRYSWPWNASIAPLAIVLIWVGECWWTLFGKRGRFRADGRLSLGLTAAGAVLGLCLVLPFDMKYGQYGTPVLSVAAAIALSHVFFVGCMQLARMPVVCSLAVTFGQASLVILFLHRFFVLYLSGRIPGIAVFLAAAIIPLLVWLVLRRSPLPIRQALLGDRPPVRKNSQIAQ